MRYPLIPGLVLFMSCLNMTNAFAMDGHWPEEVFDVMDNQRLVIFLENEDIAESPEWQPTKGRSPLSIADVLKLANVWISQNSRLSNAKVHEIELKPISKHEHRWYYLLQLQSKSNGKITEHYIAVLLNGKVVPAIAEPTTIK